jgi:hypothetical protein
MHRVENPEELRNGYINGIKDIWLHIDSICNQDTHKHGLHQQEHPKSHLEFVQGGGGGGSCLRQAK